MLDTAIQTQHIKTNGVCLHTALAGPEHGEPVLLLHGFPDAWFGWEAQIGPLAEAGSGRAVDPWLRTVESELERALGPAVFRDDRLLVFRVPGHLQPPR